MRPLREFFQLEATSGFILVLVAVAAIIVANSPWHFYYETIVHTSFGIHLGSFKLTLPLIEWINQGLMSIFFLLVGLEIKREIFQGELNSLSKISLPAIAAIGGMIIPAFIYLAINFHNPLTRRGWAIPTATDIAFTLAILNLLGNRIPVKLKVFLTALAIFDDIGAIIIIAFFYTAKISWMYLSFSLFCLLFLILLNRWQIKKITPYLLVGLILWFLMLQSGIHAVLAGIALAFAIPLNDKANQASPLITLEHKLNPWVAFLILPLFGFTNAGVSFIGVAWQSWFNAVTLGVFLGLFIGKQIGVFGSVYLASKLKWTNLLADVNWLSIYGIALICGCGFTMSLFIGTLAFDNSSYTSSVRLGVLLGSLISGILGYAVLRLCFTEPRA